MASRIRWVSNNRSEPQLPLIADLRINETLQTGAVENRTYRVQVNAVRLETAPTGDESVYLFSEFTIMRHAKPMRLETAPTGFK